MSSKTSKTSKTTAAAPALTLDALKSIGWSNMTAEQRKTYSALKKSANSVKASAFVQSAEGIALAAFVNDATARATVKRYLATAREHGGYNNFRRAFYAACKVAEGKTVTAPAPAPAAATAPAAPAAAPATAREIITERMTAAALAGDIATVTALATALSALA